MVNLIWFWPVHKNSNSQSSQTEPNRPLHFRCDAFANKSTCGCRPFAVFTPSNFSGVTFVFVFFLLCFVIPSPTSPLPLSIPCRNLNVCPLQLNMPHSPQSHHQNPHHLLPALKQNTYAGRDPKFESPTRSMRRSKKKLSHFVWSIKQCAVASAKSSRKTSICNTV